MCWRARPCGRTCGVSASGLLEDGVEHLGDEALLGAGEPADALELTLELGRGTALAGLVLFADELVDGDGQKSCECWKHGGRDAPAFCRERCGENRCHPNLATLRSPTRDQGFDEGGAGWRQPAVAVYAVRRESRSDVK